MNEVECEVGLWRPPLHDPTSLVTSNKTIAAFLQQIPLFVKSVTKLSEAWVHWGESFCIWMQRVPCSRELAWEAWHKGAHLCIYIVCLAALNLSSISLFSVLLHHPCLLVLSTLVYRKLNISEMPKRKQYFSAWKLIPIFSFLMSRLFSVVLRLYRGQKHWCCTSFLAFAFYFSRNLLKKGKTPPLNKGVKNM